MGISNNNDQLLSNLQECETGNSPGYDDNAIDDDDKSHLNYLDESDIELDINKSVEAKHVDTNISPDRRIRQFIERMKDVVGSMFNEEHGGQFTNVKNNVSSDINQIEQNNEEFESDDDDKSYLNYLDESDIELDINKSVEARNVDKNLSPDKRIRQFIERMKNIIRSMFDEELGEQSINGEVDSLPIVKTPRTLPLHARSMIPLSQKRTAKRIEKPPTETDIERNVPAIKSLVNFSTMQNLTPRISTINARSMIPVSQKKIAKTIDTPRTIPNKLKVPLATVKKTITKSNLIKPVEGVAFGRRIIGTPVGRKTPSATTVRRIVPIKRPVRKSAAEQMLEYQNNLTPCKLEDKLWRYAAGIGQDIPFNYKELLLDRMRRRIGKRYYAAGDDVTEEVPPVIEKSSQKLIKTPARGRVKWNVPPLSTIKRTISKPTIDKGTLGIAFGRRIVTPAARKTPRGSTAVKQASRSNKKLNKEIAKQMVAYQNTLTPSKLAEELWQYDPESKEDIPENFLEQLLERMRRVIGKRLYTAGDEITDEVPDVNESSSEESSIIDGQTHGIPNRSTLRSSRVLPPRGVAFGRKISFTPKGTAAKQIVPTKPPARMTVADKMVDFQKTLTYHKLREKKWIYTGKKDLPKNYKDLLLERMRRAIGKRYYPDGEEITVDVPAVKEVPKTVEKSATKVAFGRIVPESSTVKKSAIKPPGIAFGRKITQTPAAKEKRIPKVPTPKLSVAEKMQAYQNSLTQEKLKEKLWNYTGVSKDVPKNYKALLLERMRRNIGKRFYPAGEEITYEVPGVNENPTEETRDSENIVKPAKEMSIAKQMLAYQNALTPSKLNEELWHYRPDEEEDIPEDFYLQLLKRMRRTIGKRYYSAGDELTENVPDDVESSSEENVDVRTAGVANKRNVRIGSTVKRSIMKPSVVKSLTGIAFGRKITTTPAVTKTPSITTVRQRMSTKPPARKSAAEQMLAYQNTLTPAKLDENVWRYTAGTEQDVPKNYKNLLLERMRRSLGKRYYPDGEDITDEMPGVIRSSSGGLVDTEIQNVAQLEITGVLENINIETQYQSGTQSSAQIASPSHGNPRSPHLIVPANSSPVAIPASKQKPQILSPKNERSFGSLSKTTTSVRPTNIAMSRRKPHLVVPIGSKSIAIPKQMSSAAISSTGAVPKQKIPLINKNTPIAGSSGLVTKRISQLKVSETATLTVVPKKTYLTASPSTGAVPKQVSRLLPPNVVIPVAAPKKISPVVGASTSAVPKRLSQLVVPKKIVQAEITKKMSLIAEPSTVAVPKQASRLLPPKNFGGLVAVAKKISPTGAMPKQASSSSLLPPKIVVPAVAGSSTGAVPKQALRLLPPNIGCSVTVPKKISPVVGSSTSAIPKQLSQLVVSKKIVHAEITKKMSPIAEPSTVAVIKQASRLLPPKNIGGRIALAKKISPVAGPSTDAVPKQASCLLAPKNYVPIAVAKEISSVAGSSTGAVPKQLRQLIEPNKIVHAEITNKIVIASSSSQISRLPSQNIEIPVAVPNKISPVAGPSTGIVPKRLPQLVVAKKVVHNVIPKNISPVAKYSTGAVSKQASRLVPPNVGVPVPVSKKISPVTGYSTGAVPKRLPELRRPVQNIGPLDVEQQETKSVKLSSVISYTDTAPKQPIVVPNSTTYESRDNQAEAQNTRRQNVPREIAQKFKPKTKQHKKQNADPIIPGMFKFLATTMTTPTAEPYQPPNRTVPHQASAKEFSKQVSKAKVLERSPKFTVTENPAKPVRLERDLTPVNIEDLEIDMTSPSAELLMLPSGESLISMARRNLDNFSNNIGLPLKKLPDKPHKFKVSQKSTNPVELKFDLTPVNMEDLEIDMTSPSAELLMLPSGESLISMFRQNLENRSTNNELPSKKPPDKPHSQRVPLKKSKLQPKRGL